MQSASLNESLAKDLDNTPKEASRPPGVDARP